MFKIQQLQDNEVIELTGGYKRSWKQKKRLRRWKRRKCRECSGSTKNDKQTVNVVDDGKGNKVFVRNHIKFGEKLVVHR